MTNRFLSVVRGSIPYIGELQKIDLISSPKTCILITQLEYWFERYTNGFYKFLEPCPNNKLYNRGDSWTEELWFSSDSFRRNFDKIGIRYNSKTEFENSLDKFNGKLYCSYHDKLAGTTHYFRNHELVDLVLNEFLSSNKPVQVSNFLPYGNSQNAGYVTRKMQDRELAKCELELYTETTSENSYYIISLEKKILSLINILLIKYSSNYILSTVSNGKFLLLEKYKEKEYKKKVSIDEIVKMPYWSKYESYINTIDESDTNIKNYASHNFSPFDAIDAICEFILENGIDISSDEINNPTEPSLAKTYGDPKPISVKKPKQSFMQNKKNKSYTVNSKEIPYCLGANKEIIKEALEIYLGDEDIKEAMDTHGLTKDVFYEYYFNPKYPRTFINSRDYVFEQLDKCFKINNYLHKDDQSTKDEVENTRDSKNITEHVQEKKVYSDEEKKIITDQELDSFVNNSLYLLRKQTIQELNLTEKDIFVLSCISKKDLDEHIHKERLTCMLKTTIFDTTYRMEVYNMFGKIPKYRIYLDSDNTLIKQSW